MQQQQAYHPKDNHPWRQYRNRKATNQDGEEVSQSPKLSLHLFLKELVENWDTYKIPPPNLEDRDYIALAKLKPDRQAEWLMGFIKKHWMGGYKGALILE